MAMASIAAARPFPHNLPSSSSQRRPRPSTSSSRAHYRPFSTLYTESPYVEIQDKPAPSRRLKRSSSLGGLQVYQNMPTKEKAKSKMDHSKMPKVLETPKQIGPPLRLVPNAAPHIQKFSTSKPLPPRPPVIKKKRSMVSLFQAATDSASSPVASEPSPGAKLHAHKTDDAPKAASPATTKVTRFADDPKVVEYDSDVPDQFVPKSIWARRHGMKLHPYQGEATYMQSYDPILLESDRYSDLLLQRLSNGMPSFFDYRKKPPVTALDLGCGQGHWILHAANVWKNTQITGLDLVDVTLPAFQTIENVHFVQGDFVQFKLPFPDDAFEYVRMANLVLCIPYDKWEYVLSEARRVLTIGGRLELIDDQITFPYNAPKVPSPGPTQMKFSSGLDDFDNFGDDSDTLQGDDCASTESTLHGDECTSHWDDDEDNHLAESETIRPLAKYLSDASGANSAAPALFPRETRYSAWKRQKVVANDLEVAFERMLRDQHGVVIRPSDFIVGVMSSVFGKQQAGKKKSFHVKLAPPTSPIGVSLAEELEREKDDLITQSVGGFQFGSKGRKAWIPIDWEKVQKKKGQKGQKEAKTFAKNTSTKTDGEFGSGSSSGRSSLEDHRSAMLSTPLPASVNAKAASKLGIELPGPSPRSASIDIGGKTKTLSSSPVSSSPIGPLSSSPTSTPLQETAPVSSVSAKLAGRLGVSYSKLTQLAAVSRHRKYAPVQSPGVLVWPSTYIAMSPTELEMHACKFIHTLLGCKPALAEYFSKFVGEDGKRMMDDDEISDTLWQYECFRRMRFNWPSDITDPYEEDPASASTHMPTFVPLPQEIPSSSDSVFGGHSRSDSSDSFNGQYRNQDLTHLRTIRIFQATKEHHTKDRSLASVLFGKNLSKS